MLLFSSKIKTLKFASSIKAVNLISMNRIITLFLTVLYFSGLSQSENISIKKVEPPFWWTGMKSTNLQILVYGPDIGLTQATIDYPGVILLGTQK